jgi:L-threonylcarbamoyladenylate synthase
VQILNFHPGNSRFDKSVAQAVELLQRGGLVAIPTETVYGLAGDATNGAAVAKIFEVKKRPRFNPLIAHVSGLEMAQKIGLFDAVSLSLARRYWPGPLTLVVNKNPLSKVHDLVSANLDTIGIRCPGGAARRLIDAFGRPLAAPSANRSGRVSPTTASHVATEFTDEDIIVLDGGASNVGIESTIARIIDGKIKILRAGSITDAELADNTGLPVESADAGAEIRAPGMMASHYAPHSQVILNCRAPTDDAVMLSFGTTGARGDRNLSASANLIEAAANLYRHIRELDELGTGRICIAPIPQEGLGIAINDRLSRMAAPRLPQENSTDTNSNTVKLAIDRKA